MITGIHHVAISTNDLDRSLKFYQDLMGLELVAVNTFSGDAYDKLINFKGISGKAAMLRSGNTHIELFEFSNPEVKKRETIRPAYDHGITHICFNVKDIEKEYKRLSDAGVNFHCPLQKFGDLKVTYGRDPDGNIFELLGDD